MTRTSPSEIEHSAAAGPTVSDSAAHTSNLGGRSANSGDSLPSESQSGSILRSSAPIIAGLFGAGAFYVVVLSAQIAWLDRYFLGHPVAYAATILFCIAIAILAFKAIQVQSQRAQCRQLRDQDCLPDPASSDLPTRPADRWRTEHDAGHVARQWLRSLAQLPNSAISNPMIARLREILHRQSNRGTTKHLSDDLRELSIRDGDAAHDSLGLVRIIVWAIPMLGFLGTVIGITQTLGGLDFTDGSAAVDRLKSGLYVAFDTTALGLVLSVFAIFLQFPVERSEQRLLADIESRVSDWVLTVLPADDPADNQALLITQLCDGIRVAVAESLSTQAELWRETIGEAQDAWRTQHAEGAEQFRQLMAATMVPFADAQTGRMESTTEQLASVARQIQQSLERHATGWRETLDVTTNEVQTHRRTMMTHTEAMTQLAAQTSESPKKLASEATMMGAMKTLAQAVNVLADRLPTPGEVATRRAA